MKGFVKDLLEMIFPACCEVCGRSLIDGEELLCMTCDFDMPRVEIESSPFNQIHQRLASPNLPIEKAVSQFYYFRDNPYAKLIQKAKYSGRPRIAYFLARKFALQLKDTDFFDGIDLILPMPLHVIKKLKRGYNQTTYIANGLSEISEIPVGDNLKIKRHNTQTRLSAEQRLANMSEAIRVEHAEELRAKHVLVVDDVITTGSTMFAAVKAIHETCGPVKISVLSLGLTKLN